MRDAQDVQQKYYDRQRVVDEFREGDLVALKRSGIEIPALGRLPEKLRQVWIGPFRVLGFGPHPDTYKLDLPVEMKGIYPVFHVGLLKKWVPSTHPYRPSSIDGNVRPDPVISADGHEERYIEKILDCRMRHRKPHYLVQWRGYPAEEATWESREDLEGTDALEDWILVNGELVPQPKDQIKGRKPALVPDLGLD